MGDVRREVSPVLALELRAGYLWKRRGEGFYIRRLKAIPIQAGIVYLPLASRRARAGVTAAAGFLFDASMTGSDPVGGVNGSGTGVIGELGITGELALSHAWALEGRTVGRYAIARNVLPGGGDIDLSGIAGSVGLRVSFAPRAPRAPRTPPEPAK